MNYNDFSNIVSAARMNRYLISVNGNSRKAMTLYRENLRLSQELFTVISCFEIALRNKIDEHYTTQLGNNWLQVSVGRGGIFDTQNCDKTRKIIMKTIRKLGTNINHNKLVAALDFGFWRHLFASPQYRAGGTTLLQIFPAKPRSTSSVQYNQAYVFNKLTDINEIRNRIAHHEPICFRPRTTIKDTTYTQQHYSYIHELFRWMQIDEASLLYGLDHINQICQRIDRI